ncbi:ImmA/IrrE family metallo-endopeptidase [Polynucleobacter paneuropaeus]|nr:ImmA/IrrE family metallo-endopeptidase [Polynucleobacter paneuropaeus]
MSDRRLSDATLQAEILVRDESLALPIDILALAKSREILVEAKPSTEKGVSGMLLRVGDDFAIGYATHIKSIGFQRFSIAHELGHYFLGHADDMFRDGKTVHESQAGFGSKDLIELEADHFAAGLLMPSELFKEEAARHCDGLAAIERVAEKCQTSITSSAIRYAQLTDAAVAIIVSSKSSVDYCFVSQALRAVKGYRHPVKGSVLPRDSLTRDFNQTASNIAKGERGDDLTDLYTWFQADDEIEASEEVIGLGDYGRTLTIITADLPDEDESGTEWTAPRFR